MKKYFIKLDENSIVTAVISGGEPFDKENWIEVESNQEIQYGMKREKNGKFNNDLIKWDPIRAERNGLLADTDWTQLPDVLDNGRLTQSQVDAFASYRQQLADIPQDFTSPDDVIWPTKPNI